MGKSRFKKGDRVKCSHFLYKVDNKYKGRIGTFDRYNRYGNKIAYVYFGQPTESVRCFTFGVKLVENQKNVQLLFNFMN